MDKIIYPIDWSFDCPTGCNERKLLKLLREMAAHWRGWEKFPWYLTRTLHRHMDQPPVFVWVDVWVGWPSFFTLTGVFHLNEEILMFSPVQV